MRLAYVNSSKYSNVKEVLKAEFSMSDRLLLKLKKLDKIYLNGNVTSVNHPVLENNLIEYFNKKNIDEKLLIDLKFFFKNGLSSTTRYKTALILKKYNMLNNKEIESLKYDANYKIRQKFKKFQF